MEMGLVNSPINASHTGYDGVQNPGAGHTWFWQCLSFYDSFHGQATPQDRAHEPYQGTTLQHFN